MSLACCTLKALQIIERPDIKCALPLQQDPAMFLEELVKAANGLFAIFWTVVIVALPLLWILGWIIQWFEG